MANKLVLVYDDFRCMNIITCHYKRCRLRVCEDKALTVDGKQFCSPHCATMDKNEKIMAFQLRAGSRTIPRCILW